MGNSSSLWLSLLHGSGNEAGGRGIPTFGIGIERVSQTLVKEYEESRVETGGQVVLSSWFPSHDVPEGNCHGSAGICVTATGEIVLITQDGKHGVSREEDRKVTSRGRKR